MRRKSRRGVALAEVLVAFPLGLLVCGLVVALLWFGFASLSRTEQSSDRAGRALGALAALRAGLQDAQAYAAHDSILKFVTRAGEWEAIFDGSSGKLSVTEPGSRSRVLLPAGVSAFSARELFPGLVRVTLELAGEKQPRTGASKPPVRFHDDVLVTAVSGE